MSRRGCLRDVPIVDELLEGLGTEESLSMTSFFTQQLERDSEALSGAYVGLSVQVGTCMTKSKKRNFLVVRMRIAGRNGEVLHANVHGPRTLQRPSFQ